MTGSIQIAKTTLEKTRHDIDTIEMLPDAAAASRVSGLIHVVGALCDVLTLLLTEARKQ